MTIEKWSPLKELDGMRTEMDRIWEELLPSVRRPVIESPWRRLVTDKAVGVPPVDIIDRTKEVVVRAEMPGVSKDDLDISLKENTLTIRGTVNATGKEESEEYYYSERSYRTYERSVSIPFKINPNEIKASLKDGVLSVHIAKAAEVQPRKIKVEVD